MAINELDVEAKDEINAECGATSITGWVDEKKYSVNVKLLTRSVDSVKRTVIGIDGVTLVELIPKNVQYREMVWLASDTLKQPVKDCFSLSLRFVALDNPLLWPVHAEGIVPFALSNCQGRSRSCNGHHYQSFQTLSVHWEMTDYLCL